MTAAEYLQVAFGGNMNFGTLKPLAIENLMDSYLKYKTVESQEPVHPLVSCHSSKTDIKQLCDGVIERYVQENVNNSKHYCIYCWEEYGNAQKWYIDKGKTLPHKASCLVLIARKLLAEIDS